MRFLVDVNLSVEVAGWLRGQGYDAVHLREEDLQRLPDPQVRAKAVAGWSTTIGGTIRASAGTGFGGLAPEGVQASDVPGRRLAADLEAGPGWQLLSRERGRCGTMEPTIIDWSDIPPASSGDTVRKRRLAGQAAELVLVEVTAGTRAGRHSHPHE